MIMQDGKDRLFAFVENITIEEERVMKRDAIRFVAGLLVLLLLLTQLACGSKEATQPSLVLKELRPDKTKVGKFFNPQPNQDSAIVCVGENMNPAVVVLFNGVQLETAYGNATWVSAFVPKKYYQAPGEVKVSLLDTKTNVKSNSLNFKVEP
jgi:hypothetical protein